MNGESGPGYQTGNMGEQGDEPGAVGNRLSLDPNDDRFAMIKDWEDGKRYRLTLDLRQISPGEFEAVSAEEGQAAEPEAESEEAPPAPSKRTGAYSNPAIENL